MSVVRLHWQAWGGMGPVSMGVEGGGEGWHTPQWFTNSQRMVTCSRSASRGVSGVHAGWGGMHLGEVGALGHGAGSINVKDVLKQRPRE